VALSLGVENSDFEFPVSDIISSYIVVEWARLRRCMEGLFDVKEYCSRRQRRATVTVREDMVREAHTSKCCAVMCSNTKLAYV
jgi:hypothetical protein